MKTYEILKMIDEEPKKMIGKRYEQIGGLVSKDFGIGDIAVVTEYFSITSLGAEKFSRIRLTLNGFEEWREVKEPVSWQEAFVAGLKGKKIKVDGQGLTYPNFENLHFALTYLSERPDYFENLMRSKWYID